MNSIIQNGIKIIEADKGKYLTPNTTNIMDFYASEKVYTNINTPETDFIEITEEQKQLFEQEQLIAIEINELDN